MASITKPVLLAVIGILAVVLFLQTTNLITGLATGGQIESSTDLGLTNSLPTVAQVAFTMTTAVPCSYDSTRITCTANVTDVNGYSNISVVTGQLYGPSSAGGCAGTDNNTCLNALANCVASTTYGTDSQLYTCTFGQMEWYAENGTDSEWTCNVTASDGVAYDDTFGVTTQARSVLRSLDTSQTISWGTQTAGATSVVTHAVRNCGNRNMDTQVNASDMTCTTGTITAQNDIYSGITSTGNDLSMNGTLSRLQTVTVKPTQASKNNSDTTYWNITVPNGVDGTCAGTAYFVAIEDK